MNENGTVGAENGKADLDGGKKASDSLANGDVTPQEVPKGSGADVTASKGEPALEPNGTSSEILGAGSGAGDLGKLKAGPVELPRLEALARKLGLDEFEKGVVTMLTGVAISPVVKSIYEADDGGGSYRRTADTVQVYISKAFTASGF